MSPGGLYRYYDGRDALLTELISDGFAELAAAVVTARDEGMGATCPPAAGGGAGLPAVGRRAPARVRAPLRHADPRLRRPHRRADVARVTLGRSRVRSLFVEACGPAGSARSTTRQSGSCRPPRDRLCAQYRPDLPAEVAATLLVSWSRLHGPVVLEVFNHCDGSPMMPSALRRGRPIAARRPRAQLRGVRASAQRDVGGSVRGTLRPSTTRSPAGVGPRRTVPPRRSSAPSGGAWPRRRGLSPAGQPGVRGASSSPSMPAPLSRQLP
jgi:AcrR family transcriptional regulator